MNQRISLLTGATVDFTEQNGGSTTSRHGGSITRRRHRRQSLAIDRPLAIITDGGADVATPKILPWRPTLRILDWFHMSMQFEHILQRLRGLCKSAPTPNARLLREAESAKWRLCNGRPEGSLKRLRAIGARSDGSVLAHVSELIAYLSNNRTGLVNYGSRHRAGLPISTSSAESAVESVIGDRFKKNRKMCWTTHKGADALLHVRVADLNGEPKQALARRNRSRLPAAKDDWPDWLEEAA